VLCSVWSWPFGWLFSVSMSWVFVLYGLHHDSSLRPMKVPGHFESFQHLSCRCRSTSICQVDISRCQRLNFRDSMTVAQCLRPRVRVESTNMVTGLCYSWHLGVQFDIGVRMDRGLDRLCHRFLICYKALSKCRLATHNIYVLVHLLQHGGIESFCPVWNAGRPSLWDCCWCYSDGCSVDMRVAELMWGFLSRYDSRQVNVDWSEWRCEDCMCYIPTSSARCTLTHAQRVDHSNKHCNCDANMQVDPVEIVPQIETRRVWRCTMLVSWDKSNRKDETWLVVSCRPNTTQFGMRGVDICRNADRFTAKTSAHTVQFSESESCSSKWNLPHDKTMGAQGSEWCNKHHEARLQSKSI